MRINLFACALSAVVMLNALALNAGAADVPKEIAGGAKAVYSTAVEAAADVGAEIVAAGAEKGYSTAVSSGDVKSAVKSTVKGGKAAYRIALDAKKSAGGKKLAYETGNWEIKCYVDEFDMPTEDTYITNKNIINGKFSNSATTDSYLAVLMAIDNENVSIFLYEYGRSLVKNYSMLDAVFFKILMLTEDGEKSEISGTMYCGGDRIVIDEQYKNTVLNALRENDTVSFTMVDSEIVISKYSFSVETAGISAILEEYKL